MPSLRSFDLNLLVLFDALFREGQLSAAADSVGMSQPAASQALARLRGALNDPLFVRRGRGMEPTALAEALAPNVREALRTLETKLSSLTAFDPATTEREFSIWLGELGEAVLFPRFLAQLTKAAPHVRLRSVLSAHAEAQQATLRGDLDLSFDFEPPVHPTLRHAVVGQEEFVLIARRGHPRVSGAVSLPAVLAEPRVHVNLPDHRWARILTVIGAPAAELTGARKVVCTVGHITTVPGVVAETDALAFMPRSLATHATFASSVQVLEAPLTLSPLPLFAFWHESADADPAHLWLRQALTARFWAPHL